MEFNQLANLIGLAAEERDTADDFKMNLFPDTVSDAGGIGSYSYKDSNVIDIDLGKTRAQTQDVKKKILKDFDNLDIKGGAGQHTGDDLLDLMDNL